MGADQARSGTFGWVLARAGGCSWSGLIRLLRADLGFGDTFRGVRGFSDAREYDRADQVFVGMFGRVGADQACAS